MKITIISNPRSGSYNKIALEECARILSERMGNVSIVYTECCCHATELAAQSDADIIIAAGGDGLINEVAQGVRPNVIFSVLPFGTRNVFCRQYGVPLNPIDAANKFNPARQKKISVGTVGSRIFLLMCGAGYDAQVVKSVVEKKYNNNKTFAHILEGFLSLFKTYKPFEMYVNGRQITCYHTIISLVNCYAGSFTLTKSLIQNMLNTFVVRKKGVMPILTSMLSIIARGTFPQKPLITEIIKISGTYDLQIDGEYYRAENDQNYITIKKDYLTLMY